MKLYVSPMSPFVRKVRVVASELGLAEQIEVILCRVRVKPKGLEAFNPFGRVPTLILDDGSTLFDSPVICEYFDSLSRGKRLLPAAGRERWQVLRQQAIGDGIMDAATPWREERHRPDGQRSPEWLHIYSRMVHGGLDLLEREVPGFKEVSLGTIAIGCALGYLDFRFPEVRWREGRQHLSAWFKDLEQRESFIATRPYEIRIEDL